MLAPTGFEHTAIDLAVKGFGGILTSLGSAYAKRIGENGVPVLITNLSPYLESTHRRCSIIKTLLNPLTPALFTKIYSTQRFTKDSVNFDNVGLVNFVNSTRPNVIVSGNGGSGKSMFMRHLWLSLFEEGGGRIPLYVELRHFNSVSHSDFLDYLFHTVVGSTAQISRKDFDKRFAAGDFVLVLDGFDEVIDEKKDAVQGSILQATQNHKSLQVVVSGRPDQQFASWPNFFVVEVAPLQKNDVVELVEKAEFDEDSKDRFLKRLQSGDLYARHHDLLGNPLLASMMLLTFSHSLDVPDQMHLFYEQAFDALYQRHDSYKPGGYKREFKSGLGEDEFRRLLSYLCLLTYFDRKLTLQRVELLEYIKKSAAIESMKINPEDFLHDLTRCVCLLTEDGLDFTFSHRSFQEFFTAYCLARVTTKGFTQLCEAFTSRSHDQVLVLLAAMNPEAFRERYVLPYAGQQSAEVFGQSKLQMIVKFMDRSGFVGGYEYLAGEVHAFVATNKPYFQFATLLARLQSLKSTARPSGEGLAMKRERVAVGKMRNALGYKRAVSILVKSGEGRIQYHISAKRNGQPFSFAIHMREEGNTDALFASLDWVSNEEADIAFQETFLYKYIGDQQRLSSAYLKQAREETRQTSKAMSEIFGV